MMTDLKKYLASQPFDEHTKNEIKKLNIKYDSDNSKDSKNNSDDSEENKNTQTINKWKLLKLEFNNMFSYGEDQVINFEEMNGIVGIMNAASKNKRN